MPDDEIEKDFEPFKVDIGKKLGGRSMEVTVVPERTIIDEGVPHICLPVRDEDTQREYMVEGSQIITARCGHRVWIAPSGQRLQALSNGKNPTICGDCAEKLLKDESDPS